ncbi:MAG: hypothetical protein ABSC94_15170 [Polyangiaceae bacterium]|jgi:hypothetical protein
MSPKASPLLGYNNNVRYKGRIFHIQTEDSGVRYGHVITHLFMDGGRILKSVKTSYAEHVGSERQVEVVRELMKRQHKAMFTALRDGTLDPAVERASLPPERSAIPPAAHEAGPTAAAPPDSSICGGPSSALTAPPAVRSTSASRSPKPAPPVHSPAGAPELPPRSPTSASSSPTQGASQSTPDSSSGPSASPSQRRQAATRPASPFGQARPQQGKTIFGEDPQSDKSLDAAILDYLSADPQEKE